MNPQVTICDIDGTIADCTHRLFLLKEKPTDWETFHFLATNDTPILENIQILQNHYFLAGLQIYFVTARPERTRDLTEMWLRDHVGYKYGIHHSGLFMRKDDDHRNDDIIKREIFEQYFADKEVRYVLEDRPRVVKMYRDLGLTVIDCGHLPESAYI